MTRPSGWAHPGGHRVGATVRFGIGVLFVTGHVLGAQAVTRTIAPGATVSGRFGRTEPVAMGRGAFHAYRFEAAAGGRYRITMRSADLDAFVWVAASVGGITDELVSDDDGGGDTDAQLLFRPSRGGSYLIVAQSLDADETGAYSLSVESVPPPASAVAAPLVLGQLREGELRADGPEMDDGDETVPYVAYALTGRGERVRVSVRSGVFDAMVRIVRVGPQGEILVTSDDDSGGGTDAEVTFVADGTFRIYVRAVNPRDAGGFVIVTATASGTARLGDGEGVTRRD